MCFRSYIINKIHTLLKDLTFSLMCIFYRYFTLSFLQKEIRMQMNKMHSKRSLINIGVSALKSMKRLQAGKKTWIRAGIWKALRYSSVCVTFEFDMNEAMLVDSFTNNILEWTVSLHKVKSLWMFSKSKLNIMCSYACLAF